MTEKIPGSERSTKGEHELPIKQLTLSEYVQWKSKIYRHISYYSYYSPLVSHILKSPPDTMKSMTNFLIFHDMMHTLYFFQGRCEGRIIFKLRAKFLVWSAKFSAQLWTVLYSSVDFKVLENVDHMLLSISSCFGWW